jgi:hypothetical protein
MTSPALRLVDGLESLDGLLFPGDEVFDEKQAAAFLHLSLATLRRRDVPRAVLADEAGRRGRVVFLKSQLILYVLLRTSPRLKLVARDRA